MRTTAKLSFLSLAAAAMIAGSATSAAASNGDYGDETTTVGIEVYNDCGNTPQIVAADPLSSVEGVAQDSVTNTICQIGEDNEAINYAPHYEFLGDVNVSILEELLDGLTP
ncbi:hypothetical protein [Streptomyces zingiberis]|uniref:Secreted protein n=1 Tax=Streptomyces zingiberis TaxID=2053010 RepID=A0ABX1BQJ4_9ACTN|nr:hypothetical protein [Streptomyces zingiberis]NJP99999.1 hypothetical protein [Streptomyces zingiberis]